MPGLSCIIHYGELKANIAGQTAIKESSCILNWSYKVHVY